MEKFCFPNRAQRLIGLVIILITIGLITGGLYYYFQKQLPETTEKSIQKETNSFSSPQIYISSSSLQQGDTLLIKIKSNTPADEINGELGSTRMGFFKPTNSEGWDWVGIAGIDARKEPGKYNLVIDFSNGDQLKREIEITERRFPITELFVTEELREKGYTPSKIVENITTKENLILKEILSVYAPEAYFNTAFINPLEKIKIVGAFGNIRKSGNVGAQHLGVDLDASVGTLVYAVNDGLVRFSQNLATYGKTLIIDHGLGIYSLYLHLSEFKVLNEARIKRGDIIGLSGNTGYSIAPHLHFSVKVNGSSVDPLRFIGTIEKEM